MLDFLSLPSIALNARVDLPTCAGIYFVIAFDGVARQVLYIGKAKNINTRWQNHHRLPDVSQMVGVSIFWLQVEDVATLDDLEREFIAYFEPTLNGTKTAPDAQGKRRVVLNISTELAEKLDDIARKEWRTPSAQLERMLEEAIREYNAV